MKKARRTWREKLDDNKDLPRVVEINGRMRRKWGEGTMVIPAPREVDGLMRQVPEGKLATINLIRFALARRHKASMACPITTGIFASIAARAAFDDERRQASSYTPYWRTLKEKGELNPKYPGGCEDQRTRLEAEGHTVVQKGVRFFVKDYEKALAVFGS